VTGPGASAKPVRWLSAREDVDGAERIADLREGFTDLLGLGEVGRNGESLARVGEVVGERFSEAGADPGDDRCACHAVASDGTGK